MDFVTRSPKGKGRSAERHYGCMTIDDIMALPVASWAADDAVLLMWTTKPMLPRALEVIGGWDAWGDEVPAVPRS